MSYSLKMVSRKAGLPPGTLIHIGEAREDGVIISRTTYDRDTIEESSYGSVEECLADIREDKQNWINIDGLHKPEIIEKIGAALDIDTLVLEDIMNTGQRPKIDDYGNYLYAVLRMIYASEDHRGIETEQVSILITKSTVVTFQEKPGDVLDPLRERLRMKTGRIRGMPADFLAYAIIDGIIDNYFIILENLGNKLDELDDKLTTDTSPDLLKAIHEMKNDVIMLRKSVWPAREMLADIDKSDTALIDGKTKKYFRDVYDHTVRIIDSLETFRDVLSSMTELYMTGASNRMNQVMKVLTIISTIFIPMTFIAGIYGMNFKYMPELGWKSGYYLTLILMAGVFVSMLVYFKRKKWF
ncbi:MAG: magnesium/cobalt transporter CorA [Clostridia bacterium]